MRWRLAREDVENLVAIAKAGALPKLVELLSHGTPKVQEGAAVVLGNLAAGNAENKVAIAETGVIPRLVELLNTGTPTGQERAAGALQNLSAHNDEIKVRTAKARAIRLLVELLRQGTPVAQEFAAGVLWNLTGRAENLAEAKACGALDAAAELSVSGTLAAQEIAKQLTSRLQSDASFMDFLRMGFAMFDARGTSSS